MDKQMIEEMAKLVQGDMCGDVPCEECNYHGKMKILPKYCGTYLIAKKLYNAGYRKIPENAVVLTEREHEIAMKNQYDIGFKFGCKETAEKFAERAKEVLGSRFNYIDSLIKSKIDEICKEFTEGKV